jgi:hypothetical protein
MSDTCVTSGVGLIVIVKVSTTLLQPSLVAITSIVPTMSEPVKLAGAVNNISPLPDAGIPIAVFVFVQANVAPVIAGVVVNGMLMLVPAQKLWSATAVTTGCGFRVIVKLITELVQLFFVAVTVAVPVIADAVLFVANVQPVMLEVVPLPAPNPNAAKFVTFQL